MFYTARAITIGQDNKNQLIIEKQKKKTQKENQPKKRNKTLTSVCGFLFLEKQQKQRQHHKT